MNIAANLRGWYWMGFRLGDKYIKISQNARKNPIKRIQDKMSRNLYLAANPLVDSNFNFILNQIETYRPKIIRCYPDPLLFLARHKKNHPEYKFTPFAINTTGNTLHTETRFEIEQSFGCKIFDSYRCEGNSNVFECETHSCYHSTEEYGISEILDENNNSINLGIGRLVSTDLWNLAHPFIRYETQDMIEIDDTPCKCGRKLLRINKILGRDNDILVVSGRKFIVHNFTGFFQIDSGELNRSIEKFQIIQKKNANIEFRLVVNNNFNSSVSEFIKKYWEKEFKCNIVINVVEEIPLLSSGKHKFIIHE
jgi:phenylacetate-CoA ligase